MQFRITGDAEYIYMLFIFRDTTAIRIGDDGATFIAVTNNRNETGHEVWFAGESDTKVRGDAKRLYQVVVNLADGRYTGRGLTSVTDGLRAN